MKKIGWIVIAVFFANTALAQSAISIKTLVATFHMPNNESNESREGFGFEPGGILTLEQYLGSRRAAFRLAQGFFHGNNGWESFSQLNLKFRHSMRKHAVSIAIGPSFFVRKAGINISQDPIYTQSDDWEYKVQWLSGEFEYSYYINTKVRLVASINHISYNGVGLSLGIKYWLPKKKDCNCPSFKRYR